MLKIFYSIELALQCYLSFFDSDNNLSTLHAGLMALITEQLITCKPLLKVKARHIGQLFPKYQYNSPTLFFIFHTHNYEAWPMKTH